MVERKKSAKKKIERKEENGKEQEVKVSKKVKSKEERQLIWFFVVVVVVFLAFLVPYVLVENQKKFDFAGAKWKIEDHDGITAYHARFDALDESEVVYNLYLRGDPRENNVEAVGDFVDFKVGGIVAISPEVDECRGEIPRVMLDLGGFLRTGVGVGDLTVATNDWFHHKQTDRPFADCSSNTNTDKTIVSLKMGESKVIQDSNNLYCYEVYIENCADTSSIEKFMIKTVDDITKGKTLVEESEA